MARVLKQPVKNAHIRPAAGNSLCQAAFMVCRAVEYCATGILQVSGVIIQLGGTVQEQECSVSCSADYYRQKFQEAECALTTK